MSVRMRVVCICTHEQSAHTCQTHLHMHISILLDLGCINAYMYTIEEERGGRAGVGANENERGGGGERSGKVQRGMVDKGCEEKDHVCTLRGGRGG